MSRISNILITSHILYLNPIMSNIVTDELLDTHGKSRRLTDENVRKYIQSLSKLNEDERYGWEFSQIDPYYEPKSSCGPTDINFDDSSIMSSDPYCTSISKILVIYTGGTIGMKLKNDGYQPENNYFCKALRKLPMFHDYSIKSEIFSLHYNTFLMPRSDDGRRIIYVILEYDPLLDSCDITMDDYIHIAKDIETGYDKYDGFIVLHGTDTLAYTASCLSFILENLSKPVLVTGSQIPIFELRSDGRENFLTSLLIVSQYNIPEVMVFFHDKLMRGNRCSKLSSVHLDAFDSPNYPLLGKAGVEIVINSHLIREPPSRKDEFYIYTKLCPDVSILRIFPSITYKIISDLLSHPIQGVVLQTYGSGNIPCCRENILECFKEASERGVIIVNISQCNSGGVKKLYKSGLVLQKYGVISGMDMTPEAALSKLTYVLGKTEWPLVEKRKRMSENLRGELSFNICSESMMNDKQFARNTFLREKRFGILSALDINIQNGYNKSQSSHENIKILLHLATRFNRLDIVNSLVSTQAADNNLHNDTPFYDASINKEDFKVIQLLHDKDSFLNFNKNLDYLIVKLIQENQSEIKELLYVEDFNVKDGQNELKIPLHSSLIKSDLLK